MSLGGIGAVLTVLVVVFIVGRLWFIFVEAVFGGCKRLLRGKKEPPASELMMKQSCLSLATSIPTEIIAKTSGGKIVMLHPQGTLLL